MAVTPEEYVKYRDFSKSKIPEMGSVQFDKNTTLWHYTNGAGLLGIIENGTLRATHVACVNDSTETLYASRLYTKALAKLANNGKIDEREKQFLLRLIDDIGETPGQPANAASKFFITCFSDSPDDVNQWLKYGGQHGENGYAIGFKADQLPFDPHSLVVKVSYDSELHLKLADDAARSTLTFYREGLVGDRLADPTQWATEFFKAWDHALYRLTPLLKDACFSSELEFRMVHELQNTELSQIKLLQKETMLARYLDLKPNETFTSRLPRLPIAKVIVGPGRHQKISGVSLKTRLTQLGYQDVPVIFSERPVQRP